MFTCADNGRFKAIAEILHDANASREPRARIQVPHFQADDNDRQQVCFGFVTDGGPGCRRPTCRYAHIDLADSQRVRTHVPAPYLRELREFLKHNEIKRYYVLTRQFQDFLASL